MNLILQGTSLNIFSRNISLEKLTKDNRLLLISNTFLAVALAFCSYSLVTRHETTVLVPPQLNRSVTIGWNSASREYVKSFALYVATLAGNITTKNAEFVVDNLSTLVSPRIFSDVRKNLLAQSQSPNFIRNASSTHFSPERIIYEDDTGRAYVLGAMTFDGAVNAKEVKPMIYDMVIKMVDGKPVIDAITNYLGNEPHNDKYNQRHAAELEAEKAKQKEALN